MDIHKSIIVKEVFAKVSPAGEYLIVNTEDSAFFVWDKKLFGLFTNASVGKSINIITRMKGEYEHIVGIEPEFETAMELRDTEELARLSRVNKMLTDENNRLIGKMLNIQKALDE